MSKFRKLSITVINAIIILWLVKIIFFPDGVGGDMFFGLFILAVLVFLVIYDCYMIMIYKFYPKNPERIIYEEILFVLLLLFPLIFAFVRTDFVTNIVLKILGLFF